MWSGVKNHQHVAGQPKCEWAPRRFNDPGELSNELGCSDARLFCLGISNTFMTFAWYGQLKFPNAPLWILIPASWGIAFFEYCFAVPANHFGARVYSAAQLKDDAGNHHAACRLPDFSPLYLGQPLRWNHAVAFVFLVLAAYFGVEEILAAHSLRSARRPAIVRRPNRSR